MIFGKWDFILVTANVPPDWDASIAALAPDGRLHFVGAVLETVPVAAYLPGSPAYRRRRSSASTPSKPSRAARGSGTTVIVTNCEPVASLL